MSPSCFQILNVHQCVTQSCLLHLGVICFVGCLVKECKGENCNCHMVWFKYDRNAFLVFLYGGRVCFAHCGYDFNLYFLSSSPAALICWVQLKLQRMVSRSSKAEVLSQQSEMTCCPRCRWQVCPSCRPGWARDCSSSPRSSYHRKSQEAALPWESGSSFRWKEPPLIWVPWDCLGTIQRSFVLHWVDPVQTVISLQRVSYSKENKESQEKPSSGAYCILGRDYLRVSWKGALENAKAACN